MSRTRLRHPHRVTALGTAVLVLSIGAAALPAQAAPAPAAPAAPAVAGVAATRATPGAARTAAPVPPGQRTSHVVTAAQAARMPAPRAVRAGSSDAAVARAFATDQAAALGLRGTLGRASTRRSTAGGSVVRLPQLVDGVPVLGGEVVVDVSAAGRTRGAISRTLPLDGAITSVPAPVIGVATAAATARGVVARATGAAVTDLVASAPAQYVYDPRVLGGPGIPRATPVWRTEVTSPVRPDIRTLVLVDSATGAVALAADQIAEGKDRSVCDAASTAGQVPCTTPLRSEGGLASVVTDVNDAYELAGVTYDWYSSVLGRDSIDGAGLPLKSTVRYCPSGDDCPYQNAFWNGKQMVYGEGYAAADDVVAHELTHGVTEYTNHLFYLYQAGAINESLSDIFGEFVDQANATPADTADAKWKMGEDLSIGALRDMAEPELFNDPDRTGSPLYYSGTGDSGGVHHNSGVGNKFAALLTDGTAAIDSGPFNGQTVTGLGIAKAARIIYAASALLPSAADYQVLGAALRQACSSLVGTAAITAADCTQVDHAVLATEMDTPPLNSAPPTAPALCAAGRTPATRFADDFENPASGGWTRSGSNWFYASETNPDGFDVHRASSGTNNMWGADPATTTDSALAMAASVVVPAGSFLRFTHAHSFESYAGDNYDGGVVEYSTDAGASWTDAGALITVNGYNGTLLSGGTNPLEGRNAFVNSSTGFHLMTSVLDLATLAGQSVRFRFRIGSDEAASGYGWFVDDVRLHTCATAPAAPVLGSIAPSATSVSVPFTFGADNGGAITTVQYSTDGGTTWTARSPAGTTSPLVITGLARTTGYSIALRAVNAAGPGTPSGAVAVTTLPLAPGAPGLGTIVAGTTSLTVPFTAPVDNGGSAITNVEYSTDGGSTWTPRSPAAATSPLVITGLTPATAYSVALRAVNAAGAGAASSPVAATTLTVPSSDAVKPVLRVAAVSPVSLTAPVVTWTATDNVGVASYTVRRRVAAATGVFGAWTTPTVVPSATRRYAAPFVAGTTTCIEVVARDAALNLSPATVRCVSTPLDDRALTAGSRNRWKRAASAAAYLRTTSTSTRTGDTLTLSGARGRSIALVVRKVRDGGSLAVFAKGRFVQVLTLRASRTTSKVVVRLNTGVLNGAPITIRVLVGRSGVVIDGLAVIA